MGEEGFPAVIGVAIDPNRDQMLARIVDFAFPFYRNAEVDLRTWRRPGIIARFDTSAMSLPRETFRGVSVQGWAAGEGFDTPGDGAGQSVAGFRIDLWLANEHRWQTRFTTSTPTTSVFNVDEARAERSRALLDGQGQIRVAILPRAGQGGGLEGPSVALDYIEIEVDYDLTAATCGDGIINEGEECDDGDTVDSGNGCSANCARNSDCGDGSVQSLFESCDPPLTVTCAADCQPWSSTCCEHGDSPGCDIPAVQACICQLHPDCCTEAWTKACVREVAGTGCGSCP